MAFPDLISTSAYQEAILTGNMMGRASAIRSDGGTPFFHSAQVRDAGNRLDHLIRRALDPNTYPDWPPLYLLSAIKAFVEVLETRIPHMHFPSVPEMHDFIDPRLELARSIITRCDARLDECHEPLVSSAGFRQDIGQWQGVFGFPFENIVLENPLCVIENAGGVFGRTPRQQVFHTHMLTYWH